VAFAAIGVGAAVLATLLRGAPAAAQPVGSEFQANSYTSGAQRTPRVATAANGNFVVVWSSNAEDGSGYGIFGRRFTSAGSPLGGEFRVNTYTSNAQATPAVASDSSGNFVVVWGSSLQDGSGYGVVGQRFDSSATPLGPEFIVNVYTTGAQSKPSVASDASGNFVVVWQAIGIVCRLYDSVGSPIGGEFRANTYTTNPPSNPSVASDSSGNFVVVWQTLFEDGFLTGVFGQRFDAVGSALGVEFRANTFTSTDQFLANVSRGANGTFVVVWQSFAQEGSGFGVFGQRYDAAGVPLGGEFRANTTTTGSQSGAVAAVSAAGDFIVVWQSPQPEDSSGGVFGQRYDTAGTPIGGEFLVNAYTSGGQISPSVAAEAGGRFVVVWQSNAQDGSGYGIFGVASCPTLASVTIDVSGTATVCPTGTGGTATVTDSGGGVASHQWGYRTVSGGTITDLSGETALTYLIKGASFPGAGSYFLVCVTTPACGVLTTSNEVAISVTDDALPPAVTAPASLTTTQTLCM
jgi:hypothetical protein